MFNDLKNWISKNPKKVKIYVFLIGIILLSAIFRVDASASSIVDTLGDPTEYMSEHDIDINDYPYYVIKENEDHTYRYIFSKEPFYVYYSPKDILYIGSRKTSPKNMVTVIYDPSSATFSNLINGRVAYTIPNYTFMIYSNHNIKYKDDSTFFYASPSVGQTYPIIGQNISTQTILLALAREILTILPSLVVLVVSLMALRKALGIILNRLGRA